MFEKVTAAPPDAILGLTEAFKKDPRPDKVNLSVGVFKDDQGRTHVLKCVKEAERRLLEGEATKTYLSIEGSPEYGRAVRELMFGADHEIVKSGRACTAQCPGGTGALRVSADFIKKLFPTINSRTARPYSGEPSMLRYVFVASASSSRRSASFTHFKTGVRP